MRLPQPLATQVGERRRAFRERVLTWARANLRPYPWRESDETPYHVMVAELLLKRTTATAAARAYDHVLRKYPSVERLASASEEELKRDLKPVGLHVQRAKAMVELATYLMQDEGGVIPASLNHLLKVPGLGEYSARAVLSFAHAVPVAVVDANVERVIRRVFQGALSDRPARSVIQEVADDLLARKEHQRYNFGLLDLGAAVCRYSRPKCEECPVSAVCDFYRAGGSADLPRSASWVREARLANGMSLTALAEAAGVSKLTIVNIEAGRTNPRPETVTKLKSALEI